ncbi:MAG: hypothetical protein HC771_15890, partial [Synechococcales cyanobacterium CRU_2_2]|nr:hypothetical protein [Synechococcales cyanobacterium CRU_2_2]
QSQESEIKSPPLPTPPFAPPERFSISLTQGNTTSVNELIVIQTDDPQGRINGITPGEAGYNDVLLQQATVVFSTLKLGRIPDLSPSRTLLLTGNGTLQFAVIENGSLDSLRRGGAGQLRLASLADSGISLIPARTLQTPGSVLNLQVPLQNGAVLSNVVLQTGSSGTPPLGSRLQGSGDRESELLDFRGETGVTTATFEVYRDAAYDNLVGFYFVEMNRDRCAIALAVCSIPAMRVIPKPPSPIASRESMGLRFNSVATTAAWKP